MSSSVVRSPGRPAPLPRARVGGPVAAARTLAPAARDLLLLRHPDALRQTLHPQVRPEPLPSWAAGLLRASPWVSAARAPVVIGRSPVRYGGGRVSVPAAEKWIPVTLAGTRRGQEFNAFVPHSAVAHVLRPESLLDRLGMLSAARTDAIPALRALRAAEEVMAAHGLVWGPIGEVGYELASGLPVTRVTDPLSLLVRTSQPITYAETLRLRGGLRRIGVRTVTELETRRGVTVLTP